MRGVLETLKEINGRGTIILLAEQNANMALKLASRGHLMETGHIVPEGTLAELAANPEVKRAYIGA